jgi:hypothetical protein
MKHQILRWPDRVSRRRSAAPVRVTYADGSEETRRQRDFPKRAPTAQLDQSRTPGATAARIEAALDAGVERERGEG